MNTNKTRLGFLKIFAFLDLVHWTKVALALKGLNLHIYDMRGTLVGFLLYVLGLNETGKERFGHVTYFQLVLLLIFRSCTGVGRFHTIERLRRPGQVDR